jgi:LysR family transcriptional regulator, transcription activator of glutamate synthase operon
MEIRQIQYFLSIAGNGSFSSAAEELYISQSSLSKQIIALEKELGFPLFDRSKRKIAITPAGETFLKHARSLNEAYQVMMSELGEHKTAPSLSIVAIPVIAQYGITSYFVQFENTYPDINLILEEREAASILPAMNNHQYDLAFIRDNYLDGEIYTSVEVSKDKLLAVVSRKHRYAERASISLAELSSENFIMFDKGTIVHELTVDACRQAGFEPRIFYASLRVESILGLVSSNSGIALMMEKIFDYHKPPDVVSIPLKETIESNMVLAWMRNKKLSRIARIFVEFMEKTLVV